MTTLELRRLRLPLTVPYHLSFGPVEAFDTVLVTARDATGEGHGEATILTGYTDETIDGAWREAQELAPRLATLAPGAARDAAAALAPRVPFLATAFVTAFEMLADSPRLRLDRDCRVPILAGVNATELTAMRAQIDALCAAGYRTLKVKVGTDAVADAARVRAALAHAGSRAMIRLDANQGYSPADALRFANAVPAEGVELFEQPCAAGDWDAHMAVAARCPLPLMLDESIYDERDIDRCARLGAARFVKLKLMKFASLDRLALAIERIRALGMAPVLGNGVAGDIGCWMELCVAARHIDNAGEMNGWLRPRRSLLRNPLAVRDGAVDLPAGWRPRLDPAALDAGTVERCVAAG